MLAGGWYGATRFFAAKGPGDGAAGSLEERVHRFCSYCHLFPPPEILSRERWEMVVDSMYDIAGMQQEITGYPSKAETLSYIRSHAPARLEVPRSYARLGRPTPELRPRSFRPAGLPPKPAVSYLRFVSLFDERQRDLLICDMRHGQVLLQQLYFPGHRSAWWRRSPIQ